MYARIHTLVLEFKVHVEVHNEYAQQMLPKQSTFDCLRPCLPCAADFIPDQTVFLPDRTTHALL